MRADFLAVVVIKNVLVSGQGAGVVFEVKQRPARSPLGWVTVQVRIPLEPRIIFHCKRHKHFSLRRQMMITV